MNGNDKHTPGQNMTKEIHRDLVKELVDTINQYNYDYERTEILTRNSNEFEGAATENEGRGVVERDPHKLYNKNPNLDRISPEWGRIFRKNFTKNL